MSRSLIREASLEHDLTAWKNTDSELASVRALLEAQPDSVLLLQMLGLEPYESANAAKIRLVRTCRDCGQEKETESQRWRCHDCELKRRRELYREKHGVSVKRQFPTTCEKHQMVRVYTSCGWRCVGCRRDAAKARWQRDKEQKA